jgi:rRNA maturation RNase YbeY
LLGVNQSFLNHDYYTDIITFDYTEGEFVSGDLFVSYERILDHATLYDSTLKEEFLRVCVHGVLHLLGYKDKNDEEISLMRSKELFYISNYVSRET